MEAKEYGEMINKYTASGAISVSISLAKDVGILDILYESEEPLTSQQIAEKGGLKERYVRELLGALVTGRVVQVDQSSTKFHIKPELKPVLKMAAIYTRFPVYFGQKYEAIMECFPKDGRAGVRYSEYPGIFDIMDELRISGQDRLIDEDILGSYPSIIEKLKSAINALEIGSANGTIILNLSGRFPKSRFTGTDVVESVLDIARVRADERGIKNCDFTILDVCNVPETPAKQYDWIFVRDVIHDLPKPREAIKGVYRMLKPGGIFTMMDYVLRGTLADHAGNIGTAFYYTGGTFICIPESFQGGESEALGPCWGIDVARGMIANAGFKLLKEHQTEGKHMETTFVCRKPE